jgi:hypothetical protein
MASNSAGPRGAGKPLQIAVDGAPGTSTTEVTHQPGGGGVAPPNPARLSLPSLGSSPDLGRLWQRRRPFFLCALPFALGFRACRQPATSLSDPFLL